MDDQYLPKIARDENGIAHIVALSGGKDSTAMALWLSQNTSRPYTFICTPTGNELPEMFAHWRRLKEILGDQIWPVMGGTLGGICEQEQMIPNFRARFCTRLLKIAPYKAFLLKVAPAVSYVGLRADEEDREGIDHGGDIKFAGTEEVTQRYPLRELGWGIGNVLNYLMVQGVTVPERTDCGACFYQTIGEWWRLWKENLEAFLWAEEMELTFGHTWRSQKFYSGEPVYTTKGRFRFIASHRDTWPAWLKDMRELFEAGFVPKNAAQRDIFRSNMCRVCTL